MVGLGKAEMSNRILDMLQEHQKGYHPLVSILEITHECDMEDYKLKLECHKTIAKYTEAERKAVEVRSDGENLFNLRIDIDGE